MKKYLLLTSLSILFGISSCMDKIESPNPIAETFCFLADSVITINGVVTEKYTFEYNSKRQLIRETQLTTVNGAEVLLEIAHAYDNDLKTNSFETKSGEIFKESTFSYYDNSILKKSEIKGGDDFDKERIETTEFNEKGLLIHKKIVSSNLGTLETKYNYDQHDNLISELNTSNFVNFYPTDFTYKYDDQNRLIERISTKYPNKTSTLSILYDNKGNISETRYYNRGVLNAREKYTYTYNTDDTVLKKSIESSSGPSQFKKYEYDNAKNLVSTYISTNDKDYAQDAWYTYYANGNHKETTYLSWLGLTNSYTEKQPFSNTSLKYSETGILEKQTYTTEDKTETSVFQRNMICD